MRVSNVSFMFAAALVLLCLRPEVQAETISIVASNNAMVGKDKGNENLSEAESLNIQSDGTSTGTRFAYLRFDVSPLAGATITSASLDLYSAKAVNSIVYVVALNDAADAGGLAKTETTWNNTLTWNTRPDGTAKMPNLSYTSGILASLDFLQTDPMKLVSFALTDALPGLLKSDRNNQITLILYGNGASKNYFASLDNTGDDGPEPNTYPVPTLTVEYTNPIPEPGTLALLGAALLGLGWYAWRKRR